MVRRAWERCKTERAQNFSPNARQHPSRPSIGKYVPFATAEFRMPPPYRVTADSSCMREFAQQIALDRALDRARAFGRQVRGANLSDCQVESSVLPAIYTMHTRWERGERIAHFAPAGNKRRPQVARYTGNTAGIRPLHARESRQAPGNFHDNAGQYARNVPARFRRASSRVWENPFPRKI